MPTLYLTFAIHAHQPVGNFDSVIQETFDKAYSPFIEELARHPAIKLGIHFSGPLYDWFDLHAPEYCSRLRELAERGQIEILSGGYYEPILAVLPETFRQRQIAKLSRLIWQRFGQRPRGMWLAERVWEPQLASTIARAGIEYALLDDTHFKAAGLEDDQLNGYFITEDAGAIVALIPGAMKLRYLIPFADPEETIEHLRLIHAGARGDVLLAMGDDLEKFGTWPETYDLCYTRGWLNRFFTGLEECSDWMQLTLPCEYLASHRPSGRVYLPTTSYMEMGEWSLPAEPANRFASLLHRAQKNEGTRKYPALEFLRGGFWRNFLSKYRESNLIHKRMLAVCDRLVAIEKSSGAGAAEPSLAAAEEALLKSQCNDAYWHGVFGGIYSPHLRTAVAAAIISAESHLDAAEHHEQHWVDLDYRDFDCDGYEECLISTRFFSAAADLDEGGICFLDYKPRGVSLINSLQRRPEAYHADVLKLAEHAAAGHSGEHGSSGDAASIHSIKKTKEDGLGRFLVYDKFPRNCFTAYLVAQGVDLEDFSSGSAEIARFDSFSRIPANDQGELLFGATLSLDQFAASRAAGAEAILQVRLRFDVAQALVSGAYQLTIPSEAALHLRLAVEFNINFHAPDSHDRYYLVDEKRLPLKSAYTGRERKTFALADEWQGVRVELTSGREADWCCYPVYTVSQSESGFERVFQGSAIVVVTNHFTPFEVALRVTDL